MAIGIYFAPPAMTRQQYFECIKRLKKAGAGHPTGRVYHASFGTGDRVQVFDVWTSQAAFDKFGRTLMPILQDMGTDSGTPVIMEMHNVITRPAARPRAAAAKRAPAKRATARRATTRTAKKR
jgi:hypothetical protein